VRWEQKSLDVASFFPVSQIHAIRSTKAPLDTISREIPLPLDVSVPSILSLPRYETLRTLDIGHSSLAYKRGLSQAPFWEKRWSTIDLFPPLTVPYGSLDVRGEPIPKTQKYPDIYRRSLPWSLHTRRIAWQTSRYLRKRRRPILYTLFIGLGLTVPILFYTRSLIEHAYGDLLSLKNAQNRSEIEQRIHASRGNFERASLFFAPFRFLPFDQVRLWRIALDGWLSLTRWLDRVIADLPTALSGSLVQDPDTLVNSPFRPLAKDITPLEFLGISEPTTWMREHRSTIEYLNSSLRDAGQSYTEAHDIDTLRATEIAHIGRWLLKMSGLLDTYLKNDTQILALLGADTPERYIVLNQNRDEIRANGGFPGSVMTFTVFQWNIEDYRTDDVYYYDWNLYPFRELPPPGLALISGNYGLRDVNYYPDFRDTLEKANSFIERSGDPTVTIWVALHQWLIEDILSDIGPVSLSWVTDSFRSDNFSLLMSILVESRFAEETSAKDILRRFVDAFARKIHEKRAYEEVITHIEKSIQDGEILFASRNDSIDNFLWTFRKSLPWENLSKNDTTPVWPDNWAWESSGSTWSGQVITPHPEYTNWAYPLLTSLSGNKSDRVMGRSYLAETTRVGKCTYMNKLTFTHRHNYTQSFDVQVRSYLAMIGITDISSITKMLAIQGKVLAPLGATLTGSTAGIIQDSTKNAEEFAFTLDTPFWGIATKVLRYTLDIPNCEAKSLPVSWYEQPWLQHTKMESK
jgi:hypothetical protein